MKKIILPLLLFQTLSSVARENGGPTTPTSVITEDSTTKQAPMPIASSATLPAKPADEGYGKGLTINLNESGSRYVRFIIWNQFWLSSSSETPGVNFSIRRSRVLAYTQFTPRFLLLTHFGLNSLGATGASGNPNAQTSNSSSMFLHDAWGEFAVKPTKLHIGAGLHYWDGFNRLSNASTLNFMTLDNPGSGVGDARLFPWANITTSDQFARQLGIYAKGTVGKFTYRVSANNSRKNVGTLSTTVPSFQVLGNGQDWNFTGYVNYNIFDGESDKLPYFVGTYLGKKKVLNIGFGAYSQPHAIKTGTENAFTSQSALTRMSVDVFYDAPVGTNGGAINAYGLYMTNNYGPDKAFNQGGLVPGSGDIIYGQFGYLIPGKTENRFMPYVTYSSFNLKNTPNISNDLGLGINWFISGHNAKLTYEYNTGVKGTANATRTSMSHLQLHLFI